MQRRASSPHSDDDTIELKPIEPKCPQCGYDLRGITNSPGARCPECGAQFPFDHLKFRRDRNEERRFRLPKQIVHRPWFRWTKLETLSITVVLGSAAFVLVRYASPGVMRLALLPMLVGGVIAAEFTIRGIHDWQFQRYERKRSERRSGSKS